MKRLRRPWTRGPVDVSPDVSPEVSCRWSWTDVASSWCLWRLGVEDSLSSRSQFGEAKKDEPAGLELWWEVVGSGKSWKLVRFSLDAG